MSAIANIMMDIARAYQRDPTRVTVDPYPPTCMYNIIAVERYLVEARARGEVRVDWDPGLLEEFRREFQTRWKVGGGGCGNVFGKEDGF